MGVSQRGWRDFARNKDEIRLYFGPDDWPDDIPKPSGSTLHPRPFLPYVAFKLETDKTIERVTVELEVPLLFAETVAWYETTLAEQGWVVEEREPFSSKQVNVKYYHPQREVSLRTVIRCFSRSDVTYILILRWAVHPIEDEDESCDDNIKKKYNE
ncbi:hypothetical protein QUF64_12165 [Anaerolineales bacterium HSG6]|nr:hypothetical protein [Anaerolineales bacterium HSG6]